MRKFNFLWGLFLCLTTVMYAQNSKSQTSIKDLLNRKDQIGKQSGSVLDHFSKSEVEQLQTYYKSLVNNVMPASKASGKTSPKAFPDPYCPVQVFTIEPMTLVKVAGINNVSSATVGDSPGLEDFTAVEGNMESNMTYPISFEGNTNGDYTNRFVVFMDWNHNGTLDDQGEVYEITELLVNSTGTDGIQVSGSITVPAAALGGPTRMRVKKQYGTTDYLNPCSSVGYGQVEDYTVNVTYVPLVFPAPYCGPLAFPTSVEPISLVKVAGINNVSDAALNGSPAHEDFTAVNGIMKTNTSYPITFEGNTAGNNTDRFVVFMDWNHNNILNDPGEVYEITDLLTGSTGTDGKQVIGTIAVPADAITGPTRMRVKKQLSTADYLNSCLGDNQGQAEDYTVNVTVGPPLFPLPYCGPLSFPTAVEPITLVKVAGINNVSDATLNGSPAHEDFTLVAGNMQTKMSYPIVFEGNTAGNNTNRFVVFMDWNHNNVLNDPGEVYDITDQLTESTGTDGKQIQGTIAVPRTALPGVTRMRVKKQSDSVDPLNPCVGGNKGQAEDYTINVTQGGVGEGPSCKQDNPSNNFEFSYNTSVGSGQLMATDINVPKDTDFTLNKITVNIWRKPEATINSGTITFYADAGGKPGAVLSTQTGVVPTSQAVIGSKPGYDIAETIFNINPQLLLGLSGSVKLYWVSINVSVSSGTGELEATTASIKGDYQAFSTDNGVTWNPNSPWDSVYIFEGNCNPIVGPAPITTVYGVNNLNHDLVGFDIATPGITAVYGTSPITVNIENAGAIDPANPTTGYVLDGQGQFFSVNVKTGVYASLGTIPGTWVGMEFDSSSDILYGISGTDLYTIDPVAKTATLIGNTGVAPGEVLIALAIDGAGVGYTYGLSDNWYSVNLATGIATLVGTIGFDANYAQGMTYDKATDMIYMSAFNNTTFRGEWRSVNKTTGATTLIGPIITRAAPNQIGWSSMGETPAPASCPKPTNLAVSNITDTTAQLSWTVEPNASNGYVWYVFAAGANPVTDTAVATGTTPSFGATFANATGLSGLTAYDFYVVADCTNNGLSDLAGPFTFTTKITPPACGGNFYDNGNLENYANSSNDIVTINPNTTGNRVTVTFTLFSVEANYDALYVYNGPDATFPLIDSGNPITNSGFPAGGYYGTTIPGPFTSTHPSGALTFVFRSDPTVNKPGWKADVTCTPVLAVEDNTLEGFSFYPNPTKGILNLRSVDKVESVTIYNLVGQMLLQRSLNAKNSTLDISKFTSGVYLMKIAVKGKDSTYRVLKQ